MKPEITEKLENLRKSILVLDIETSASYPDGTKINIRTNFEQYIQYAKCKWFGCYSYKYDKYVIDKVKGNEEKIKNLIAEHKVIASFNGEEFDVPILYNNDLMPEDKRFMQIDCLQILGKSVFTSRSGRPYKNRGELMGFKFKKNSLKVIAETMKLETQKGDIDYEIFFKDEWTEEEEKDIRKYLESDVKATKQMFDKLYNFWYPFTEFLSVKNILNFSWIRSSIASLTYKCACNALGVEETYGEMPDKKKEEMGGRVITPKYEEARKVWYVDVRSLYPHIFAMFNLFAECKPFESGWHGNDIFKVKGYYDITVPHKLSIDIMSKLKTRITLKKEDPDNPMVYAIKILLNSLYGAQRSPIFEQIHTPNAGWDVCWLGQQINEMMEKMMVEKGFNVIAGDTDSIFCIAKNDINNNKEYVIDCLNNIVKYINSNVPFPQETFEIEIENYIDYIMWPIDMKTGVTKKKNYVYLSNDKVSVVGLPVIKDNATKLGQLILKEVLIPMIKKEKKAKFLREDIKYIINKYLDRDDALSLLSKEFKVKPFKSYKKESQIQAQISLNYFDGQDGVIRLIKNTKIGKVGKGNKYCTVEDAKENNLNIYDVDLTKIYNELQPFCESGFLDDEKDKKIMERYLGSKQAELDKFFESDLFDSDAVGDDVTHKEFLDNEIFFETL